MKLSWWVLPLWIGPVIACAETADTHSAAATLKGAAAGRLHVGVAINAAQISGRDTAGVRLIEQQFDSITPENALKWAEVHPEPARYTFDLADRYVEFGTRRGLWVVGHTLLWHSQTPAWVFHNELGGDASREVLLQRLREHVRTVVGRYRGKVKGWDVANEAIRDEDGALRTEKPWYRILGEEAIFAAFAAAHDADPDAELYYNDYSLESPVKRAGVLKLVQAIRARGLRIDGVGSQEHDLLDWPKAADVEQMIADFARAGFKVMITEFDLTVLPRPTAGTSADVARREKGGAQFDPYRNGLPPERQAALAARYAELFGIFARHAGDVTRVTLWGVSDRDSWLNNWPIPGRRDHPLLFDREDQPKPALAASVHAIENAKTIPTANGR